MHLHVAMNEQSFPETTMPQTEDEMLVAAAKNGDSAAFESLVARNKRLVLAMARRMTGSSADAEDLSQQTFMKAYANLSRFGGRSSFSTWLVSIARNEARMWHRKTRKFREVTMTELCNGDSFEKPLEFIDWRPSPEATYSQKQRSLLLFSAMERLKPRMRDTLKVCDIDEQPALTAAVLLGVTVNAVKSRRLRGRLALRRRLEYSLSPETRRSRDRPDPENQASLPRTCDAPEFEDLRCPA